MLEAALSPEGSKCSNKRNSFSSTPEPRLLPTRLCSQGINTLSSLPFAHPFPSGGCYDSPSSGSPTSAFVRHLGRGWELNFALTPGFPTWPYLPAPTQVGYHELLSLRSGSLQSCINGWDFPRLLVGDHKASSHLCTSSSPADTWRCRWALPGEAGDFGGHLQSYGRKFSRLSWLATAAQSLPTRI